MNARNVVDKPGHPSQAEAESAVQHEGVLHWDKLSVDSPSRRALRRLFRHRLAVFGMIVFGAIALLAIAAPIVAPYSYSEQDLTRSREAPSAEHWLGTDTYGRDVLSRMIYGGRVSLAVGLLAVGIYELVAITLGSISGYYGGKIDWFIMRVVDIVMTFPWLIMLILLVTIMGPSMYNAIIAIGILGWTDGTRLIRGQILSLREMDYVLAARAVGAPNRRVILRHVLPGVFAALTVHFTFGIAAAILTEAALSFLNLGVQPPTPSWGNMMSDAQQLTVLERMPWLWVPPGVAIVLSVLAINFIGDGLRDALDPRGMLK